MHPTLNSPARPRAVQLRSIGTYIVLTSWVAVVGGFAVWLMGRSQTNHVGSSGLIFGYLGYLLVIGALSRDWRMLIASSLAGSIYGGMLFGLFPVSEMSWEGHVFGLLAGVAWAVIDAKCYCWGMGSGEPWGGFGAAPAFHSRSARKDEDEAAYWGGGAARASSAGYQGEGSAEKGSSEERRGLVV